MNIIGRLKRAIALSDEARSKGEISDYAAHLTDRARLKLRNRKKDAAAKASRKRNRRRRR